MKYIGGTWVPGTHISNVATTQFADHIPQLSDTGKIAEYYP
mgnify:CR=1 FL=1